VVAPVDFGEFRPRGDGVVLAEADALRMDGVVGEASPGCDSGTGTVGADEVSGVKCLAIAVDESAFGCDGDVLDGVLPVEADAEAGCAVEKDLVENGPANAASGRVGEASLGGSGIADETDAAEAMAFDFAEDLIEISEADGCKRLERVGHEAFAAGFIDWRLHGVDDFDVKTLAG